MKSKSKKSAKSTQVVLLDGSMTVELDTEWRAEAGLTGSPLSFEALFSTMVLRGTVAETEKTAKFRVTVEEL